MKKFIVCFLAAAMLISAAGCSKGNKDNKESAASQATENASNLTEKNKDDIVMTVGDSKLTRSQAYYYINTYSDQLGSNKGAVEISLKQAKENMLAIEVAKKMNIELSEDEKKQIDAYKKNVIESYGGEAKFNDFLKKEMLDQDFIDSLINVSFYSSKLMAKMNEESNSDEEKKQYFLDNYLRAKHILLMTQKDDGSSMSDEEKAKIKEQAEELLKRAESGENFDEMVKEYSEDPGSTSNPEGYVFTDGDMVTSFYETTKGLEMNKFGLTESNYGYHIIQRLPIDETPELYQKFYEENESRISSAVDGGKLGEQLEKWAQEYGIKTEENKEVVDSL